jgi:hypothetical protein
MRTKRKKNMHTGMIVDDSQQRKQRPAGDSALITNELNK